MDLESRKDKVMGLQSIKEHALDMVDKGKTPGDVRSFIVEARKALAFEVPDEEAFKKAVKVANIFKENK